MDFKKAQPGDPLAIPAATFNAMLDTTQAFQQNKQAPKGGARNQQLTPAVILVQNTSGVALDRYACVQIDEPVVIPDAGDDTAASSLEFHKRIVLKVVKPTAAHLPWAILQEPLAAGDEDDEANGQVGRAISSGYTICKINLVATTDAVVDSDETNTIPKSGASGPAEIVWIAGGVGTASATGEQLAIITIGGGATNAVCGSQYQAKYAVVANVMDCDWARFH